MVKGERLRPELASTRKSHGKRLRPAPNKLITAFFLVNLLLSLSWCKSLGNRLRDNLDDMADIIHQRTELPKVEHDPYLSSFVDEFIRDARVNGVIIPNQLREQLRVIKFVDKLSSGDGPGVMAACTRFKQKSSSTPLTKLFGSQKPLRWLQIEVHRAKTKNFTKDKRILMRELMYHELFHCYLFKGHLPDKYPGIMNARFRPGDLRSYTDWNGLVRDMFSEKYRNACPDVPM